MTFDPTKPVQTRDGRKAWVKCRDFKDDPDGRTLVAQVTLIGPSEELASFLYHSNGRVGDYGDPHPCDLINIPEKRWAVLFDCPGESPRYRWVYFIEEDDAKKVAAQRSDTIACLEFTEGDGL